MAGLDPAIHVSEAATKGVDGRDKHGHDDGTGASVGRASIEREFRGRTALRLDTEIGMYL
jgi:hypothetical protein